MAKTNQKSGQYQRLLNGEISSGQYVKSLRRDAERRTSRAARTAARTASATKRANAA